MIDIEHELIPFLKYPKDEIIKYLLNYRGILMDYSYSNLLSLQSGNNLYIYPMDEELIFFRRGDKKFDIILPPVNFINQKKVKKIGEILKSLNKSSDITGKISNIDKCIVKFFEKNSSGKIVTDNPDYIYKYSDFIDLKGSDNKFKRNNINAFKKSWSEYEISWIVDDDINELYNFLKIFFKVRDKKFIRKKSPFNFYDQDDYSIYYWDKFMSKILLLKFKELNLKGIKLKLFDKIVGFLIAEEKNETLTILIGKIDDRFSGGFVTMLYNIAIMWENDIAYINLADDGGILNLRNMKNNLAPSFLEKRYSFIYEL